MLYSVSRLFWFFRIFCGSTQILQLFYFCEKCLLYIDRDCSGSGIALDCMVSSVQFSCSVVSDFATPWTAACQASLTFTNTRSLLKLMSIESVMPSNRLILCCSLLLLPSIFPSIRVFSKVAKVLEFQLQHQSYQ